MMLLFQDLSFNLHSSKLRYKFMNLQGCLKIQWTIDCLLWPVFYDKRFLNFESSTIPWHRGVWKLQWTIDCLLWPAFYDRGLWTLNPALCIITGVSKNPMENWLSSMTCLLWQRLMDYESCMALPSLGLPVLKNIEVQIKPVFCDSGQ